MSTPTGTCPQSSCLLYLYFPVPTIVSIACSLSRFLAFVDAGAAIIICQATWCPGRRPIFPEDFSVGTMISKCWPLAISLNRLRDPTKASAVPEWSRIDKNRPGVAMDLDLGVPQRIDQHPPIEPQIA